KRQTVANIATQNDVYDLDLLAERYFLPYLFEQIKLIRDLYFEAEHHTISDHDREVRVLEETLSKLKYDAGNLKVNKSIPSFTKQSRYCRWSKKLVYYSLELTKKGSCFFRWM